MATATVATFMTLSTFTGILRGGSAESDTTAADADGRTAIVTCQEGDDLPAGDGPRDTTRTSRPVDRLRLLVRLDSLRAGSRTGPLDFTPPYGEPMSGIRYPFIPTVPLRMRRATLVPCSGPAFRPRAR